ncbi:glutamate-1-semialdehyde 2,1-aminomutase [Iamia sp. SCSIO 61187]|uniref:glutamate-1-semialdehyde 2,1-aminomutase n=1 Tax=Iamia sp. SCSIO 61187 TaxID=2722752 RepID=UPI001C62C81A|nr:glutamate-1-semialdehyde 2,1-aminomutase [Iamia sp. SCSIO 61187]QYG95703.1 glutamate-1-semialdehyde 2,1-aminomutase [Iamia sp. SCSIO 61187]
MATPSTANADLFARAQAVIPGGVNSPVRAFRSVGGTPYFVARAEGPYVWDAEGTRLLDLVQSYGAIIAGHAHPAIVAAIQEAAAGGTSYGAPTEREVLLAEEIRTRVPACERVRLVSSGTEATMSALRLARGATGRDRIVKFAGNYHGHSDGLLAEAGSAVALIEAEAGDAAGAVAVPGSAGVPAGAVADTIVAPYNVVPELDETIACVIVEPVAANMGLVTPAPGFLAGLRAECDRVGALLVFDEVITGFRLARGGAQARYGVTPDLSCFGKVIGGGLNVGAFGGRADVMEQLAPLGPVYQAGTLSGNPLATAAGLAALALLDDDAYVRLEATAARLGGGLQAAFDAAGLTARIPVEGTLVGLFMGAEVPLDYDAARTTDTTAYAALFHALLDRGVALAPGPYEILFPGLAHVDAVVDEVVALAAEAADAIAAG